MAHEFVELYGAKWRAEIQPLHRHFVCVWNGGRFRRAGVKGMVGEGNFFHYKEAASLIWPEEIVWHSWNELMLKEWLEHKYIGIMGGKNTGKSNFLSWVHLLDYYFFPTSTTVIICSTTSESLENRIWGEIKSLHRLAQSRFEWLPGNLIEGKKRLVTDDRMQATEGRDFRNGIMGLPLLSGGQTRGISALVGIKNKRLRIAVDEASMVGRAIIDATANLIRANFDDKITGAGNPSDTLDSLGALCEPSAAIGGWDGGVDQTPKTKTWETRWPKGIAIQLSGLDGPNSKIPVGGTPPYPFLLTNDDMKRDGEIWGIDDWHYTMFNLGRMPRGQGSRRVITRQMCQKFHAMDEAIWKESDRTWIAFLDAAYRGVGGDRCVFGFLQFGEEAAAEPDLGTALVQSLASQDIQKRNKRQILGLVETMVIPINPDLTDPAEDQIVQFVMGQCKGRGVPAKNFFFDSGMRTSLVQAFSRLWSPDVQSIDCGGKASDRKVSAAIDVMCKDYYDRRISEMWFNSRMIIEAGQFRGMTEDMLLEGCAREWKTVMGNKISVETKDEMKSKTSRSPDLYDALCVGLWGALERGFQIRKFAPPDQEEEDPQRHSWKRDLMRKAFEKEQETALNYAV